MSRHRSLRNCPSERSLQLQHLEEGLKRQNRLLHEENENLVNEILHVMEDCEELQRDNDAKDQQICALQKVVQDLSNECNLVTNQLQRKLLNDEEAYASNKSETSLADAMLIQQLKHKLKNSFAERMAMKDRIESLQKEVNDLEHEMAGLALQTNEAKGEMEKLKAESTSHSIGPACENEKKRNRRRSVSEMCLDALQNARLITSATSQTTKEYVVEKSCRSLDETNTMKDAVTTYSFYCGKSAERLRDFFHHECEGSIGKSVDAALETSFSAGEEFQESTGSVSMSVMASGTNRSIAQKRTRHSLVERFIEMKAAARDNIECGLSDDEQEGFKSQKWTGWECDRIWSSNEGRHFKYK